MDTGSRLSIAAIIILLGFAMYFAIAETAFATVSRIRLKTRQDKGDHRAKRALLVLDNFDKAITTVLIGTNIVHITVAAIVTVLVTRKWGISAVTAGTLVTTAVVFFAGEIAELFHADLHAALRRADGDRPRRIESDEGGPGGLRDGR